MTFINTVGELVLGGAETDPVFTAWLATSPLSHALLSETHTDTLPGSVASGDLVYGNATPKWARLAKGDDGKYLKLVSGLPSWEDVTTVSFGTTTQIPYMNADGNDFLYSEGLTFDGTSLTLLGNLNADNFVSDIETGTQPYACTSTTLNTNLNADMLDGQHGSYYTPLSNAIVKSPASISDNTITIPDATYKGLMIKQALSQTANPFELLKSDNTKLLYMTPTAIWTSDKLGTAGDEVFRFNVTNVSSGNNLMTFNLEGAKVFGVGASYFDTPPMLRLPLQGDSNSNSVRNRGIKFGTLASWGTGIVTDFRMIGNTNETYRLAVFDDDNRETFSHYIRSTYSGRTVFTGVNAGVVPLQVKLASSQTANGFELLNSSSGILALIDKLGGAVFNETGDADADFRVEGDTETNLILTDAGNDAVYLGGNINGMYFGSGNVGMYALGTAVKYEPICPQIIASGTNAPTFENWGTNGSGSRGVYAYSFTDVVSASEKEVFFEFTMPASWNESDIYPEIHWVGNVNDTTAAPRWGIEYWWKNVGATYSTTTIIYSDGSNYTDSGTDANVTALKHYVSKFAKITPDANNNKIRGVLMGRLFRNSSSASDTYNVVVPVANKCGLLALAFNVQRNTLGAASNFVK
jgi:hypothetical protein